MGKKTKTGKGRLDKFYHLAKEQGFRARSAFKLTQLAKQFDLFARANVCVDLCGAPGGWSQVAVQAMPRGSKVICVDLVPIKPIKGVVTIQSDITTQTCRNLIKQELNNKSHVCDIVLNDGAPNVGAAWSKDAYNQAELTLHAFQLACDLLRPGGTFVTKVFRSADYNSLLWAFQQLFSKVESTKPSASRAVSAEIFVVCQGFKAPPKIDPKFFSPKFVFMNEEGDNDEPVEEGEETTDLTGAGSAVKKSMDKASSLSGLLKAMAKRNRSGYTEGDDYRTVSLDEFLASKNPAELLIKCHKIICSENSFPVPEGIVELFSDLRVLGKGELYSIMKWRTKALNGVKKDHILASKKGEEEKEDDEEETEATVDVAADGDEELSRLLKSRIAEEKRDLKRQRIKDKKTLMRKKMSLDNGVVGIAETTSASFEPDLFHIPKSKAKLVFDNMHSAPAAAEEDSDSDGLNLKIPQYEVVERGSASLIEKYEDEFEHEHKERKVTGKQAPGTASAADGTIGKRVTRRMKHMAQWAADVEALGDDIEKQAYAVHSGKRDDDAPSSDESESEEDEVDEGDMSFEDENFSETKIISSEKKSVLEQRWFSNPIFANIQHDDESDDIIITKELAEGDLPIIPMSDKQEKKRKRKEKAAGSGGITSSSQDLNSGEIEVVAPVQAPTSLDEIAQVQALGSLMVRKKSRRELIEAGFNRYSRDDAEELPDWFKEEEEKFTRKQLPLTKELMTQYRSKLKEINARPIRKEAEAQGRRKRRMERKLNSLKQQAASLAGEDGEEYGSIHKAKQIAKQMKATKKESKRKTVFMAVQRKGGASKQIGGEGGRGAKVAMVDRRLKKDRRGQRNAAMRNKKGGRR